MSILTASILVYIGFGLVYYSGSLIGLIRMVKSEDAFADLKSLRKDYQGAMGVCWKILGYIFLPIFIVLYTIFIAYMMISVTIKDHHNRDE